MASEGPRGTEPSAQLPAYANEPYADFALPANRQGQQGAIQMVRGQLGREYDNWIAGKPARTGEWITSYNPAKPEEEIGQHAKADAELAGMAVDDAYAYFPQWARTPVEERV